LEQQCFNNWIGAQTDLEGMQWNFEYQVAKDIRFKCRERFLITACGTAYEAKVSNMTKEELAALDRYLDGVSITQIATDARDVKNVLEVALEEGSVEEGDKEAFHKKIDAAERIAVRFETEAKRLKH
jgi:hypothetical protein